MRILVTGGAGYIGSHTAKVLAEHGHAPVVFDDFSTGHRSAVKFGPLVEGTLANTELVERTLVEQRIEAVVHFAASTYVGESMTNPRKYFQNNVVATLSLLDAMVAAGVKPIVFSSTAATYGNPVQTPIPEDHPQLPTNPYGEGKLFVERALKWYAGAYGLEFVALRYFNAAGSDPSGDLGEDHDPETHLVPLAIGAALGTRPGLKVFGTDYPTPDGSAIRDYVHVLDLADAHVKALGHLTSGRGSDAFNLGTAQGNSVLEVIRVVERVGGRPVPHTLGPRREGDPPILVADSRRAREILGWSPRYASLESIVETAWRWHSKALG
jgi:UDP-arabinose 4-epimerase